MSPTDLMQVTVPPGEKGNARVARFEITKEEVRMATLFGGGGRGYTPPGEYTKLEINGALWMSDTSDERWDHVEAVRQAQRAEGPTSVLITGLGLGMVVNAMLQIPTVALVDVVELNQDVIDLVGPHYQEMADKAGIRLNIHHGDAMDRKGLFKGDEHWDVVWHDIWLYICGDNYDEMKTLRRKYGRYAGWQGCWCGDKVKRLYEENKRAVSNRRDRYAALGWR